MVICEAWLGIIKKERKLITKLGRLVKNDGILIITSSSSISFLSNILRRFVAINISNNINSFKKKTNFLINFFKNHLKTMKNMSCPYKDWVQDCLIGDGFLNIHPNPSEIFHDAGKEFNFFNSYPNFYSDWRWYKDLIGKKFDTKKNFLEQFNKNAHNFIDYKILFPEIKIQQNIILSKKTRELLKILISCEKKLDNEKYTKFNKKFTEIYNILIRNNIKIKGLKEIKNILKKKEFYKTQNLKNFKFNFGRELFYISLIKNL